MNPDWDDWLLKAKSFATSANAILGLHESARSPRIAILEQTYDTLALLNIRQDDLLRQALRCTDSGLFRAAHVMAWAACMDFIQEALARNIVALRAARPKWKAANMDELTESTPERQLVEVLQPLGLATKNEVAALVGLLQRRNECAHPSDYFPELNETLGYLAEVLQRIGHLKRKWLPQPAT